MIRVQLLRKLPMLSTLSRPFTLCPALQLKQQWRKQNGLPMDPYTTLVDGPDYTYLDGRLTPYGSRTKARILKQREVRDQIIDLCSEIDFAVERHEKLVVEEESRKKQILDKKLKPKGVELLKKKV